MIGLLSLNQGKSWYYYSGKRVKSIEVFPKESFCSASEDAGKHWQERPVFAVLLCLLNTAKSYRNRFHFCKPLLAYTLQEDVHADPVAFSSLGPDAALP